MDASKVIIRDMDLSSVPMLNSLLKNAEWAWKLDKLLVQADVSMRLGTFTMVMIVLAAFGMSLCVFMLRQPLAAVPVGVFLGAMPLMVIKNKKKFNYQLKKNY